MADIAKEPTPYTTERAVMTVSEHELLSDYLWATEIGGFVHVIFCVFIFYF